jgi:hypothetical protein
MSRSELDAADGVVRLYSRRLIETLEAAGFTPLTRHRDGNATFARNETLNQTISEYVDTCDRERTRESAKREVAAIKQRYKARSGQNAA